MIDDRSRLRDIVEAGLTIAAFTQGMDWAAFAADRRTQSAVLHQRLVLGEAVKRLSPEFRAAHTDIAWADAACTRDRLIHGDDTVNTDRVWSTTQRSIPAFLATVEALLNGDER